MSFFSYFFFLIVRGRQTVTRGLGNDGGEIECEYFDDFILYYLHYLF